MPDVPPQIHESTPIEYRTHTKYVDDYEPPKKSKKSWEEEEVKDNTHVQKVSRSSAQILKRKKKHFRFHT